MRQDSLQPKPHNLDMTFIPKTAAHIVLTAYVEGLIVQIMIDLGSNLDYSSIQLGERLRE